jgi:hypothetical protein
MKTLPMNISPGANLSMLFQIITGIRDRLDKRFSDLKPLTLKAAKADLLNLNIVLNSKNIKEAIDELDTMLEEIKKEYDSLPLGESGTK